MEKRNGPPEIRNRHGPIAPSFIPNPVGQGKFSDTPSGKTSTVKVFPDKKPDIEKTDKYEELQNKAHEEVIKAELVQNIKSTDKLNNIYRKKTRILYRTSTVFPFDFFPDEIIIDLNKINIIHHDFLATENVYSALIRGLHNAEVAAGPFLATLTIYDSNFKMPSVVVRKLAKNDALKIRRILLGLILIYKQGFDPTDTPSEDLIKVAEELGKARN